MKKRLDEYLVENDYVSTRSKAKDLIKRGKVLVDGEKAKKAGLMMKEDQDIEILSCDSYVSRGAYKLKTAFDVFDLDFKDKIIVDIGASTGGFTDFALQHGSKKVYAVDVGHDQLAEPLKKDERVINMEGVNVREDFNLEEKVDMAVCDLSFISLRKVLHSIFGVVKERGEVIALFKPQFEVGKGGVNERGIVKGNVNKVISEFVEWCGEEGIEVQEYTLSSIKGKKGNAEYLFRLKKGL